MIRDRQIADDGGKRRRVGPAARRSHDVVGAPARQRIRGPVALKGHQGRLARDAGRLAERIEHRPVARPRKGIGGAQELRERLLRAEHEPGAEIVPHRMHRQQPLFDRPRLSQQVVVGRQLPQLVGDETLQALDLGGQAADLCVVLRERAAAAGAQLAPRVELRRQRGDLRVELDPLAMRQLRHEGPQAGRKSACGSAVKSAAARKGRMASRRGAASPLVAPAAASRSSISSRPRRCTTASHSTS